MKNLIKTIVLFICCSCEISENGYVLENQYTDLEIDHEFEPYFIQGDSLTLAYYQKRDVLIDNESELLFGYNHTVHALDIFDLKERKFIKRVFLDSDGPNGIDRVYQFKVISLDSIAFMDATMSLKLINQKGNIIRNLSLNVTDSLNGGSMGYFYNYNDSRMVWEDSTNSFILHFLNETVKNRDFNEEDPHPIFGRIFLTGKVEFLPVTHPKIIYDRKGEVIERMPNYSLHNGRLVYGFIFESNVYTYQFSTGNYGSFGGKSNNSENIQDFTQPEQDFRLTGTWFNSIVYDYNSGLYLRTHWGSQPRLQLDSNPTTALTKPGYIMVFDEVFSVIEELKLPANYWLEDSFVFSDGMAFWSKDSGITDENILELGLLRIKRKK
jgi:hypothetical protein